MRKTILLSSLLLLFATGAQAAPKVDWATATKVRPNIFFRVHAQVGGITWTGTPHGVEWTWIASTSTVAGYNLYCGQASNGPYTKINPSLIVALNYLWPASSLTTNTTYYCVGTSVDQSGNESTYSIQASVVTPSTFPQNPQPMTGLSSKVQ